MQKCGIPTSKSFQFLGLHPHTPDKGLCPWTLLEGPPHIPQIFTPITSLFLQVWVSGWNWSVCETMSGIVFVFWTLISRDNKSRNKNKIALHSRFHFSYTIIWQY